MRVTVEAPLPMRPPAPDPVVGAVAVPRTRLAEPRRLPVAVPSGGIGFVALLLEPPIVEPPGLTRVRPSPLEPDGRLARVTVEARVAPLPAPEPMELPPTEPVPKVPPFKREPKDVRREVEDGSAVAGVTLLRCVPRPLPERELPTLELPVVDLLPSAFRRWGGSTPPKRGVTERIGPAVLVVLEPLAAEGVTVEFPPAEMRLELG